MIGNSKPTLTKSKIIEINIDKKLMFYCTFSTMYIIYESYGQWT